MSTRHEVANAKLQIIIRSFTISCNPCLAQGNQKVGSIQIMSTGLFFISQITHYVTHRFSGYTFNWDVLQLIIVEGPPERGRHRWHIVPKYKLFLTLCHSKNPFGLRRSRADYTKKRNKDWKTNSLWIASINGCIRSFAEHIQFFVRFHTTKTASWTTSML